MAGMDWYLWFIVGLWTLQLICTVAYVGKPRTPLTGAGAASVVTVNLALIVGLLVTR